MTEDEAIIVAKFREMPPDRQRFFLAAAERLARASAATAPSNVYKFPTKQSMRDHPYLNGLGQTERLAEIDRLERRIDNTIAALRRRKRALPRAWRMELNRWRRERDAGEAPQ